MTTKQFTQLVNQIAGACNMTPTYHDTFVQIGKYAFFPVNSGVVLGHYYLPSAICTLDYIRKACISQITMTR